MGGRHPVDGPLDLAAVGSVAAARRGVVGAAQLDHLAGLRVLDHALALDEVSVAQPYFPARRQPEELLWWILAEVVALDVQHAPERHLARPGGSILRVVDGVQ